MRESCLCVSAFTAAFGRHMLLICGACILAMGCALPKPETLVSPTPMQGNSGKFLNPYLADGTLTPWAKKGVNSNRAATGMGAFAAGVAIDTFSPVGGGDIAEVVAKQQAAIGAAGGKTYMKSTSDSSFKRRQDFAVFIYANHSTKTYYKKKLLPLLNEIYPGLEEHYYGDLTKAKKKPKTSTKPETAPVARAERSLHFLPVLPPTHLDLQWHGDVQLPPCVHHLLANDVCV